MEVVDVGDSRPVPDGFEGDLVHRPSPVAVAREHDAPLGLETGHDVVEPVPLAAEERDHLELGPLPDGAVRQPASFGDAGIPFGRVRELRDVCECLAERPANLDLLANPHRRRS